MVLVRQWSSHTFSGAWHQFMTDNEGNVVVSRLNEQMGMEIAQEWTWNVC